MKTNYANMYFNKYMLFIWMSKSENSKPKEYYAQVTIFLQIFLSNFKLFITIKLNKIMTKITKLNNIEHQNKLLLFLIIGKQ